MSLSDCARITSTNMICSSSRLTAKRLHNTAQGRAAHPGRERPIYFFAYPERVGQGEPCLVQPLQGWPDLGPEAVPGCAARPWAVLCNRFAVNEPWVHLGLGAIQVSDHAISFARYSTRTSHGPSLGSGRYRYRIMRSHSFVTQRERAMGPAWARGDAGIGSCDLIRSLLNEVGCPG
jgi:hypothetical protein